MPKPRNEFRLAAEQGDAASTSVTLGRHVRLGPGCPRRTMPKPCEMVPAGRRAGRRHSTSFALGARVRHRARVCSEDDAEAVRNGTDWLPSKVTPERAVRPRVSCTPTARVCRRTMREAITWYRVHVAQHRWCKRERKRQRPGAGPSGSHVTLSGRGVLKPTQAEAVRCKCIGSLRTTRTDEPCAASPRFQVRPGRLRAVLEGRAAYEGKVRWFRPNLLQGTSGR